MMKKMMMMMRGSLGRSLRRIVQMKKMKIARIRWTTMMMRRMMY